MRLITLQAASAAGGNGGVIAIICFVLAAICELLAGFNVQIKLGSSANAPTLNLMCLGFFFVIVGVWLAPLL